MPKKNPKDIVLKMSENPPSDTDPLGMYTGVPQQPDDLPVQDADDL